MNFQIKFLKFLVFTAILLLLFAGLNAQGIYIDFGNHVISRYIHTVGTDPGNDGEIVIAQVQEEYCAQNTGKYDSAF